MTYTGMFIVFGPVAYLVSLVAFENALVEMVSYSWLVACQMVGLALLFLEPSSAWFREMKANRLRSEPVVGPADAQVASEFPPEPLPENPLQCARCGEIKRSRYYFPDDSTDQVCSDCSRRDSGG